MVLGCSRGGKEFRRRGHGTAPRAPGGWATSFVVLWAPNDPPWLQKEAEISPEIPIFARTDQAKPIPRAPSSWLALAGSGVGVLG